MITKLMKKMPIGMYEKIRAIAFGEKVDQGRVAKLLNECRLEYPEYFDDLLLATHTMAPSQESKELAPVVVAAVGLATGYGMAMARKIYDDHFSGKKEIAEAMPTYEVYDPDGCIPDPIRDIFKRATRGALPRFESGMRPPDALELAIPITNKILADIWAKPDYVTSLIGPIKLAQAEIASAAEREIAPAVVYVGSAIVGAAIGDGRVGKVIDAVSGYFGGKK